MPRPIREVVDDYHKVQDELREWIDTVLNPQVIACKTVDELNALRERIGIEEFGGNHADYRMPSAVNVHFALYFTCNLDKESGPIKRK